MVLFFIATLCVSIVGLVSLLWLKRWELRTGKMVLAGVRPHVADVSHNTLVWFERVLPHLFVVYSRRAGRTAESALHHWSARALLALEHGLERVLKSLRGVTEHPRASSREASVFLRQVAEHKKKILRRSRTKRTVGHEE